MLARLFVETFVWTAIMAAPFFVPAGAGRLGRKSWVVIGLLLALSARHCHSAPLPPRRPPEFASESTRNTSPRTFPDRHSTTQSGDGGQVRGLDAEACLARLAALGVEFQAATAPLDDKACVIAIPIRLERMVVRHGGRSVIQFPAQPLIDCRLAEPLTLWIGGVVAPVFAASFSSSLQTVRTGPGYECRNRNREAAGKVSAHAVGLAIDISGFELANGQVLSIGAGNNPVSEATLQTVRTAACGWFTTVLGPGSDAAHENHLHLDIQSHGPDERFRICE
jgi:hypothetical protein